MPSNKTALTPENRRIQELEKQLAQAKSNNELLNFHSRQSSIKVIQRMKKAQPNLIVKRLCELFDISLSTYYHQTKPAQRSAEEHKALAILKIWHTQTFQTYGRRRMIYRLKKTGSWPVFLYPCKGLLHF